MTVSDADFKRWARHGASEVTVLAEIEFAYQTASGPATSLIYLSDRPYGTQPGDSPASIPYIAAIAKAPELERAIDLTKLGGRGARTVGDLALDNGNGELDFLLDVIIDGRDVAFYVGDRSWARADFRLVMVAAVASVSADNDERITVKLRDKNFLLDDTIIGDTIASGPNAGKPKPILMGLVKNFDLSPYLLDAATLTYCLNSFALNVTLFNTYQAISDLRDAGLSLINSSLFSFNSGSMTANATTDTLTYTSAHSLSANDVLIFEQLLSGSLFAGLSGGTQYWVLASGLTANDFKLSLTQGGAAVDITGTVLTGTWRVNRRRFYVDMTAATVQLSSTPAGRPTLDIQAIDAAGVMGASTPPHSVFKYILQNYTQLAASDYDGTAIDALATDEQSSIYAGFAILDRVNVLDVLDEIAKGSYSWYGWNADGVLTVGRLDLSNIDAASAVDSITTVDIVGDIAVENLPLPWGKVTVDTDKNSSVQTDGLVSTVSAQNKSLWAQQYQVRASTTDPAGTTYTANWWDYHKSAIDSAPQGLANATPSGGGTTFAQTVCDAITALFKPWTRVARCTVPLDKYALNPGDCVSVTYPRYGLDAGKNFRVASVKPRISDKQVDLVLVTQVTPDFTSTSHFAS